MRTLVYLWLVEVVGLVHVHADVVEAAATARAAEVGVVGDEVGAGVEQLVRVRVGAGVDAAAAAAGAFDQARAAAQAARHRLLVDAAAAATALEGRPLRHLSDCSGVDFYKLSWFWCVLIHWKAENNRFRFSLFSL